MSNKGIKQSIQARHKIGLANQKDRAIIDQKVFEYIETLPKATLPTLTDCAIYAGISEKRLIIYEMQSLEDSDIRQALELIRDMQKSSLIHNGLNKIFDSKITTLLLTANHGIKADPVNLTQNNIYNGLTPDILAEALELTRKKT